MSAGRTTWWSKDSAWWRRDRIVEVGQAHGPAGPAVVDWLTCEAKSQGPLRGHDGSVKAGYAAIAYGCFIASADDVRAIVATCVEVGLLDDFEESGRTFTCRISGWHDDVEKKLAATRKAEQRASETAEDIGGHSGTKPGESPDVPERPPTETETETRTSTETLPLTPSGGEGKATQSGAGKRRPIPIDPDALPDDLPEPLRAIAAPVREVLERVAVAKGAKAPTLAAVGRALDAFPDHGHVRIVGEFEHWWLHGDGARRPMRDVVMTYRNRLSQLPADPPGAARDPAPAQHQSMAYLNDREMA